MIKFKLEAAWMDKGSSWKNRRWFNFMDETPC